MTARRSTIFRILEAVGGQTSKLRLVKLAFLLSRETAEPPRSAIYEFVPYKYGPYSFTLNYDLLQLARDGWIEMTTSEVSLLGHSNGRPRELAFGFSAEIDRVLAEYAAIPMGELVSDVYQRYPWYTAKAEDVTRRAVKLPKARIAIYKTGYEGATVDGVMDRLLRAGIARIVDIRCNPVARRYGFHKSTLQRVSADLGLEYVHIADLGVPSERRQGLDDRKHYRKLFDWYVSQLTTSKEAAVAQVLELIKAKPSVLMCMEADPACCHRTHLANHIANFADLAVLELSSDRAHPLSIQ